MHWIVQNNLWSEDAYTDFINALDRMGVDYTYVKIIPFTKKLVNLDFDPTKGDWEEAEEPYIDESLDLFAYGSTSLTRIALDRGWKPGTLLNDNFDFKEWRKGLGASNLLNGTSVTCTIQESLKLELPEYLFVRPQFDNKAFTGITHTKEQYLNWAKQIAEIEEDLEDRNACLLNKNTPIALAPERKILAEYRLFVVEGKIVTGSLYKLGKRVIYDSDYLNDEVVKFAESMIEMWEPAKGYVLDIAETPEGCKVIEYNNLNCSGLYASNVHKLIEACESADFS